MKRELGTLPMNIAVEGRGNLTQFDGQTLGRGTAPAIAHVAVSMEGGALTFDMPFPITKVSVSGVELMAWLEACDVTGVTE